MARSERTSSAFSPRAVVAGLIGSALSLGVVAVAGRLSDDAPQQSVVERVAARHERELASRGIRLIRHVHPEPVEVEGDPDRLEQALQNLAANALRHTPDGGHVRMTAERHGDAVVLTVHDNGPGIPSEHLPLIFNRFYKADLSRKAAGGSGLGLSIVKAIVELHGGTISARNDNGALFEVRLPSSETDA